MLPPTELPPNLRLVRTTKVFDHVSVPAGLLSAHRIAEGIWGRLVVHTGALTFIFEEDNSASIRLQSGASVVIPPQTPHHLVLDEPTTFAIEFHGA